MFGNTSIKSLWVRNVSLELWRKFASKVFVTMCLIWEWNESLVIIGIPKYFAPSLFTKFTPINWTLDIWLNCSICIFRMLRASLFKLIHDGTFISSLSRHEVNDFFLEYIKFASSAKRYVVTFRQHLGKSFIWIIMSKGPSIEPCGTPQLIGSKFDHLSFTKTACFLFPKYDWNHLFTIPWHRIVTVFPIICIDQWYQKLFEDLP